MLENQFYQDFGSLARVLKYAYSVVFFNLFYNSTSNWGDFQGCTAHSGMFYIQIVDTINVTFTASLK